MQMKEMAEYFVKTPGLVNADYTLLKSKINTDSYIQILKEMSEEVKWEDRILYCENDEKMVEVIKSIVM